MLRLFVVALGLALAAPAAAAPRKDFSHGYLEAIGFVDQVVERARGYGVQLKLDVKSCDQSGCEFRWADTLLVRVDFHRALHVLWKSGSGQPGPIVLIAVVETLLQDERAARRLVERVPAALVENPMFNSFEAAEYTVFTYVMGGRVLVQVEPTKPPNEYRPVP